jgi:hypothetical protein
VAGNRSRGLLREQRVEQVILYRNRLLGHADRLQIKALAFPNEHNGLLDCQEVEAHSYKPVCL